MLGFEEIGLSRTSEVGAKGARLGALSRVPGVHVPAGFCVTTGAFSRVMAEVPRFADHLDRLSALEHHDRDAIRVTSARMRDAITGYPVPEDLAEAIVGSLAPAGDNIAYAVRSSATAEDLSTASFAGQQDTYLNVVDQAAIVDRVRACWASLFTDRAVTYRLHHGVDHRAARMGVVVQQMVFADASGVLFTADPVTSDRTIVSIEAVVGLGEALVSGLEEADRYTVRDGAVVDRVVAVKDRVVRPSPSGGTRERSLEKHQQCQPVLTEAQVIQLALLGRRIEAQFGSPQDVEWCLVDGDVRIVQSRPITTLFPVPPTDDTEPHVYVSVGHQQMMTEAMTPLGLSVWRMTAARPMVEAGGRLFVDVTRILASRSGRSRLLELSQQSDPLLRDALQTVIDKGAVLEPSDGEIDQPGPDRAQAPLDADPQLVEELILGCRSSLDAVARDIRPHRGPDLLEFIENDIDELRRLLSDPRSVAVLTTAMEAAWWLNENLHAWLGEVNAADTLTQSIANDVTAEMGLALLDVADVIRARPEVVDFLRAAVGDPLDGLLEVPGGREAHDALRAYLVSYGMRCVGEIDIGRPRWSERLASLLPTILGHVKNAKPGAGPRRFDQGRHEARARKQELLERVRALPAGECRADETEAMIDRLRTFMGYREYPKFTMVSRYFVYKTALWGEAEELVRDGVLRHADDIVFLRFEELYEVLRTRRVDEQLIDNRKDALAGYQRLSPPRVLTSDGETFDGTHRPGVNVPAGALVGLGVSGGTVEGRARVVHDLSAANLEPGDILVTAFTDPSWSPVFLTVAAVVTEVGGLMTHGAVVAREYGLPTVVGVEGATRRIRDGQRLRVNGTVGHVEYL